jgi:5-methylcytosine-specific restriction endonuclease McrA
MFYACSVCGLPSEDKRCERHRRPNSHARGYDHHFVKQRAICLTRDPVCTICHAQPSTIAHHRPKRTRLVALGITDPDDAQYLTGICRPCHNRETSHGR